ncbi:hypothetical protein F0562_021637 [Nyssa sinensis]|uniref:Reticulon-like protein n=1 Tax=Nyssa sinensis TaxID=561372 RepID=A0A5J5BPA0_9ASTE|nr:hypothetical protein F0562_021637 [Nyssa sinensis]
MAMEVPLVVKVCMSIVLVGVLGLFIRLYNALVTKPERLRSMLRKQGISGPPPTFLLGNLTEIKKARTAMTTQASPTSGTPPVHHNCGAALFAFLQQWQKQYDVISRACFGSSYSKGEEIFKRLRALQAISSKKFWSNRIPGMRHLPTKSNRETWALEKEIRTLILKVVKERNEAGFEKDLLQMVLEGARNSDLSQAEIDRFIVDNCKNIYLAGYETTAVSATWCLMLLASNPEWQARVRAEALEVCGSQLPNYNMICKMKQLTMVINESLRLYPPVAVVSREALKDMKFGNISVPKGVNLWTLVVTLHTDPEIWGSDGYEFNPDRFVNGITGKKMFDPEGDGVGPESIEEKIKEAVDDSSSSSSDNETDKHFLSKKNRLFGRQKPIHTVLGGGKSADIILWRNKQISAGMLAGATVIWLLFEWIGSRLYKESLIWCPLGDNSDWLKRPFGLERKGTITEFDIRSPLDFPEVVLPEDLFMSIALLLRDQINQAFTILHGVASGKDLKKFLYVIVALWILSVVGSWFDLLTLLYIIFVLLQTGPLLYEMHEDEVDNYAEKAMVELKKQYVVLDEKVLQKLPKVPFIKDSKQH